MNVRARFLLAATTLFLSALPVPACIWDTDTLTAEKTRMPGLAELITGQFPRHSQQFHEWRKDRCKKLIGNRSANVSTFDDLAVSLHKLGNHKTAIQIMEAKELLFPGLYETRSNLGTFYIYTGELNEALKYIRQALAINPNAHFGREKYQLWLVEWIQEREKTKPEEPETSISGDYDRAMGAPSGFAAFVARKENPASASSGKRTITLRQLDDAIHGVSGMMRFADFDNPLLLEAMGDLLLAGTMKTNAAQLACISYLHAASKANDPAEKKRLMSLAQSAGLVTVDFKLDRYQNLLQTALAKGQKLSKEVSHDEADWIAAGKDASAEFQKKYLLSK